MDLVWIHLKEYVIIQRELYEPCFAVYALEKAVQFL